MPFKTNLTEKAMDAGTYEAEVFSTREITTKSGYPMVWVDWRITESGPYTGGLVPQGIAFVPQMIGRNNLLLKAMGQPYGESLEIDPEAWHGIPCLITVEHRNGKAEVTDLAPLDGGQSAIRPPSPTVEPEPPDDSEVPF
jgi:hypothetical protein